MLAAFSRACYVAFPTGLVALVDPDVPPGPLHLVLDGPPPTATRGTPVSVSEAALQAAGWVIETRSVPLWRGRLPELEALRAGARAALAAGRAVAARTSLTTGTLRDRAGQARTSLLAGDLDEAAALLVGLGPGLTPAGDDALAAILLVLRAAFGEGFEQHSSRIADEARTTEPSRAFLAWAARGQALAPAHDLLLAAARGDQDAATSSCEALGSVGATSGSDSVCGLEWGLEAVAAGTAFYTETAISR